MKKVNKKLVVMGSAALILLLGFLYYWFIQTPLEKEILKYDTSELEIRQELAISKQMKIAEMKKLIEENKDKQTGIIEDYNNLEREMQELNAILADTHAYQVSFQDPVIDGELVRRNFQLSFTTSDYQTARKILMEVRDGTYKCLIQSVDMAPEDGSFSQGSEINVNALATFFEGASEDALNAGLEAYGGTGGE